MLKMIWQVVRIIGKYVSIIGVAFLAAGTMVTEIVSFAFYVMTSGIVKITLAISSLQQTLAAGQGMESSLSSYAQTAMSVFSLANCVLPIDVAAGAIITLSGCFVLIVGVRIVILAYRLLPIKST